MDLEEYIKASYIPEAKKEKLLRIANSIRNESDFEKKYKKGYIIVNMLERANIQASQKHQSQGWLYEEMIELHNMNAFVRSYVKACISRFWENKPKNNKEIEIRKEMLHNMKILKAHHKEAFKDAWADFFDSHFI